jgi:hypothetical protein
MKRTDVSGFSLRFGLYVVEVVTVRGWPCVLAVSRGAVTLWRVER